MIRLRQLGKLKNFYLKNNDMKILLAGHFHASTGMGLQARSCAKSLHTVGINFQMIDPYRHEEILSNLPAELHSYVWIGENNFDLIIYHMNADEAPAILDQIDKKYGEIKGIKAIVPAWELENLPSEYKKNLKKFEYIFAQSGFLNSIFNVVGNKVIRVSQAVIVEQEFKNTLKQEVNKIINSDFNFLIFCDESSFFSRKNLKGGLDFAIKFSKKFNINSCLTIKLKKVDGPANFEIDKFLSEPVPKNLDINLINKKLNIDEISELYSLVDVVLNPARSEGFGRVGVEGMAHGKIVIATNYGGCTDYLREDNSIPLPFKLIKLKKNDYPHYKGQCWADPDIDFGVEKLTSLLADKLMLSEMRENAIMKSLEFSPWRVGLTYGVAIKEVLKITGEING